MGGRALGITRKRSRVPDPELRRDEPDHSIGNLRRARQEDAEESDRPQLDCKPEPILIPSARGNHRTIMGVEMKVPSELLGRRPLQHTGCRRLSAFRSGSRPGVPEELREPGPVIDLDQDFRQLHPWQAFGNDATTLEAKCGAAQYRASGQ